MSLANPITGADCEFCCTVQSSYQALQSSYQALESSYQALESSYQALESSYQALPGNSMQARLRLAEMLSL